MLQLQNTTPFAADIALFPNASGIDTLYIIVKASFYIGQEWTLLETQPPPQQEDVYWTEPGQSSLKYASDFHIGKPATDIIMLGSACALDKKPVEQLDVSLTIERLQNAQNQQQKTQYKKDVRVFGQRYWHKGKITAPKPFQTMPMVFENAYGGHHSEGGQLYSLDTRNPVGSGYAGDRSVGVMENQRLPNLEDPSHLIQQPGDQPPPACFGYIAPNWQPRVSYAGTYDEAWQRQRAPYLPEDFDPRFLSMAANDLVCDGYLTGGESVHITHMHPGGDLNFTLPMVNLVAKVAIGNQLASPEFNLETLCVEPNQLQLSMVWRAVLPCDKQVAAIDDIVLSVSRHRREVA